jgi:hypothetical protein
MKELQKPIEREEDKYTEDTYMDMLDDIYGDVEICGMTYNAGYALKELDPIAFRCGMSDMQEYETIYQCPICGTDHEEYEDALYCCQEEIEADEE